MSPTPHMPRCSLNLSSDTNCNDPTFQHLKIDAKYLHSIHMPTFKCWRIRLLGLKKKNRQNRISQSWRVTHNRTDNFIKPKSLIYITSENIYIPSAWTVITTCPYNSWSTTSNVINTAEYKCVNTPWRHPARHLKATRKTVIYSGT